MDFNRPDQQPPPGPPPPNILQQPSQQPPITITSQPSSQPTPTSTMQVQSSMSTSQPSLQAPQSIVSQAPIQITSTPQSMSQPQTSVGGSPAFVSQLPAGPRTVAAGQIRQHGEYLVLLTPNARTGQGVPVRYPFIPIQRHQLMGPRATILQQPAMLRSAGQQGALGIHPVVIPTSQPIGLVQTSMGQSPMMQQTIMTSSATAPSQMTPTDALSKGTSFFISLLTKMNIKAKKTTLQNLIQALIDGKKTSEEFAAALQRELSSGPQTQLVPFLELLLPTLRQSMIAGVTKLPGIRPPPSPMTPVFTVGPVVTQTPPPAKPSDESSTSTPTTSSPNKVQSQTTTAKKKKVPLPPGQKSAWALKKEAREAKKRERESLAALGVKQEPVEEKKESDKSEKVAKPKVERPKQNKQKKQEKQLESLASALRDDDDVNDVAAMGGVNLAEESQRIMASGAELVGTQIRSCKDEPFLDMKSLTAKITKKAKEFNLPEPSKDVVTLISHATQERLKTIVERLAILAEHRTENLKFNPRYEISNDIKGQMKFLAELDRIEKRRYEEQERELLLRVAKSRSKVEDPEQQKLRQKAKDMQRAEQEEVRQREANETALLAIGPRKKLRTGTSSTFSSFSQSSSLKDTKPTIDTIRLDPIKRVKRVNMRDLQVLLELDRAHLDRLVKITAQ